MAAGDKISLFLDERLGGGCGGNRGGLLEVPGSSGSRRIGFSSKFVLKKSKI